MRQWWEEEENPWVIFLGDHGKKTEYSYRIDPGTGYLERLIVDHVDGQTFHEYTTKKVGWDGLSGGKCPFNPDELEWILINY